jgi:hypothetical protein
MYRRVKFKYGEEKRVKKAHQTRIQPFDLNRDVPDIRISGTSLDIGNVMLTELLITDFYSQCNQTSLISIPSIPHH